MGDCFIVRRGGANATGKIPEFTYSGTYQLIDDGDKNWRIKFLTSGTLEFTDLGNAKNGIDVFLVGGGGGGSHCVGGGAGYTKTAKVSVKKGSSYDIIIGAGGTGTNNGGVAQDVTGGGATTALGVTADGGEAGQYNSRGGNGGSGGAGVGINLVGGEDGADGNGGAPGTGQQMTTREFGETSGTLYATGGGTAGHYGNGSNANANTGDGGQGGGSVNSGTAMQSGNGGSGIVIIRNAR